ncbi:sigma-70 family RNA polymerase sigma factor [Chitinophaga horti]|uniref:Sigma-70 family RNA polymerase sigma factor n=1 Tax=Chitinophaga horti TaxID=2920382 RepID=A0ABY6J2E8_9BACT|nr:sigma-70 family RNA polymerase sigma factor [Chitinophaga horti]UYQ93831.1 sigma-70 family RNA polymerase sigma factor [Chitinophaga horti]
MEAATFETVYRQKYEVFCIAAYAILGNKEDAKDVVINLFADIWEKREYYQIEDMESYMWRAVKNRCFNHLSKRALQETREQDYQASLLNYVLPEAFAAEVKEVLVNAVNEMPPQRLQVFTSIYLDEQKYHETASSMGISINSVKTHMKLALKHLRIRLSENF